jgi:predicted transcriptional regulator
MNSPLKKQVEALAALSVADRVRLERLAALAEVTPEHLWPDVWLYGFDDVEEGIHADIAAAEDIAAGRTVSNEEVMERARQIVESYAKQKRRTG